MRKACFINKTGLFYTTTKKLNYILLMGIKKGLLTRYIMVEEPRVIFSKYLFLLFLH